MADLETYDGAIGIDLGAFSPMLAVNKKKVSMRKANNNQEPLTLALPFTREQMSKLVCILQDAQPRFESDDIIVANEQGSFTTPSFVSFTPEERLIGEAAKNQAAMNPENTVFDVKWVASQSFKSHSPNRFE